MELRVNGERIGMEIEDGASVGDVLASADSLLEQAGSVIVGLSVDGAEVDPEAFPELRSRPSAAVAVLDIAAESAADYRARAIELFLSLVGDAGAAAAGDGALLRTLASSVGEFLENLSGLFPAEELSFVQAFKELVDGAAAAGEADRAEALRSLADRLPAFEAVFGERLAELRDPMGETRRAAALYEGGAAELKELPVYLQTGKEAKAMQAVLLFIEIFNKVIRLLPELSRRGLDTRALRIGDLDLPSFYSAFNEVLRNMSKAIEDKDSVLIGDLAEYEVAPRMEAFFAAIGKALPA